MFLSTSIKMMLSWIILMVFLVNDMTADDRVRRENTLISYSRYFETCRVQVGYIEVILAIDCCLGQINTHLFVAEPTTQYA